MLAPGLLDRKDGSIAWGHYAAVRTKWAAEDFAKAFPKETGLPAFVEGRSRSLTKDGRSCFGTAEVGESGITLTLPGCIG